MVALAVVPDLCRNGHDKDAVGRDTNNRCKACNSQRRQRYVNKKMGIEDHGWALELARRKKFCPKGHDKDVVGRWKRNECKACHAAHQRRYNEAHATQLKAAAKRHREANDRTEYFRALRKAQQQACVYLYPDNEGAYLYIGRTNWQTKRFEDHRNKTPWWPTDESNIIIETDHGPDAPLDIKSACLYEQILIHNWSPRHNKNGVEEHRSHLTPFVYEYLDANGEVIYVGSGEKKRAMRLTSAHKRSWAHEVAEIRLTECLNWPDARLIEASKIYVLQPRHNKEGVSKC